MKKGAWAAGVLAVVVVAAGGGWLAVRTLESKTEQAVRAVLAELSATADSVDYNLLDNTLNLGRVAYAQDVAGRHSTATVENITVTGFDRACLSDASGSELPLVADSLVASDVDIKVVDPSMTSRGTIAEIRMEGWYQNLGKLAALHRQDPLGEALFAEAYRYRMDMMAYKDYRVSVTMPDQKPLTASMAMWGLLGPAGSRDASSDAGRMFSMFMNQFRMELPGLGVGSVERAELHDLLMPPPASVSRLTALTRKMEAAESEGRDAALKQGEAFLKEWVDAYRGTTPYKELVLRSYAFQPEQEGTPPLLVDEVRHKLSLADPVVFGLDLIGLHGSWSDMAPGWREAGPAFLPDGPLVDGSILLSLRTERRPSSVEWSAGVQNLGRAEGKISLELDIKNLSDVLKLPLDRLMANVFLKDADATYADQGLEALALTVAALDEGVSVEQERDVYKAALPLLSEEAGELGPMLEAAANIMLDKPGTVRIQCRPEQPLALSQAFLTLLLQPQVLNLTVSAEPGDKSLSDWVPAALRQ